MKPLRFAIAAAALAALLAAGAGSASDSHRHHAAAKPSTDRRTPLVLLEAERHLVLQEMRNFLSALQTIANALPREDMNEVARAARAMGSGAANEIPPRTVAKLPEAFKMLAGGVHGDFDAIAMDAETLGDPRHTMTQLSGLLGKCNACHGIYQIKVGQRAAAKK